METLRNCLLKTKSPNVKIIRKIYHSCKFSLDKVKEYEKTGGRFKTNGH